MAAPAARPPIPPTALIGREGEIARVRELLLGGRLVTLTGAGGTGKTRLALAVLADLEHAYPDGVAFVDLASLADPALVPSAVAQALDVQEQGGRPVEESLEAFLARRELLLCLDNFEHLLAAGPLVSRLLAAVPGLAVLTTSRAPLRLTGEREHQVPPLDPAEAQELFAVRAGQAKDGFALTDENRAAVAEICENLDHLPLAIELAAARIRALSPEKLRDRLGERLPLLTQGPRDAPARQQTLRGTIDWSYRLLGDSEQGLLARLSVFAGGCTLEAAEGVCEANLDTLASLVEQSLLKEDDVLGGSRYTLLETVREYALERLRERGEETPYRQRHAAYFLALAEEAKLALHGPDQLRWLERLERELDNLRGAVAFALEVRDAATAERLAAAFWNLLAPSRAREAQPWLEAAIALGGDVPPAVRARTLLALGHVTYFQGEELSPGELLEATALGAAAHVPWGARRARKRPTRAGEFLEEAARLFRLVGDDERLALTIGRLLWVARDRGELEVLPSLIAEALPLLPGLGTPWVQVEVRLTLGSALAETGDRERALELLEEARRISLELGDRLRAADALAETGWLVTLAGDYERAQALQEDVLAFARTLKDPFRIVRALGNLGLLAALVGDFARAAGFLRENLRLMRERGYVLFAGESVAVAAACAATSGKALAAARMAGAAEMLHEAGSAWHTTEQLLFDRHVLSERERLGQEFDEALAEGRRFSFDEALAYALESLEGAPASEPLPVTPPSMELEPGAVVGGFEIEALVGRGGMGVVYRARQRSLDRTVALKVLSPALAADDGFRARFLREARLAAVIEHPNVLPVYEAGEDAGRLFLATRYVEGENLASLVARGGALLAPRAVAVVAQVASALDAAHAKGLVHRDVKPSNILLDAAEAVYLCDFGLATSAAATRLTRTGELLGTLAYLAPEQIRPAPVDGQADQYSLACVLFECLVGEPPFPRETEAQLLWAHMQERPPSLAEKRPELSGAIDDVLARALAKEPGERFMSAGEFAEAALAALGPEAG